jgi:small subunit ribosomal protein S21
MKPCLLDIFIQNLDIQPSFTESTMIEVEVRGDLEYAIRQLKKKLQIDGIKRELKRREYYEKPSVKKRRKQAEARRKLRKFNRMKKAM